MSAVLFDAFPKQIEFLEKAMNHEHSFVLYGGAIKGGKTYAGLGGLVLLCRQYPLSRWAVVRKDMPTIRRNVYPAVKKIIPEPFCKHGDLSRAWNHQTATITFKNGSQIIFFPESFKDDPELNRWKGLDVNGFLLEEVNELQEETFTKAIERAGSWVLPPGHVQPPAKILATCNPSQGWVKKRVYDLWRDNDLPREWCYIPSRIFDNPHLPKAYVNGLKRLPRLHYRVFVLGDWEVKLKSGGEFYQSFNLEENVKKSKYQRDKPLHISFDENVNPYLPVTLWQIQMGKKGVDSTTSQLVQIGEICLRRPHNNLRKLCAEIRRRYRFHQDVVYIYGDATSRKRDTKLEEGSNFFTLAEKYLAPWKTVQRVPKANPSVSMRGRFINDIFDGLVEGCQIFVHEAADGTIHDLQNTMEDKNGAKLKEKARDPQTGGTYEKNGHLSDTLDYIALQVFRSEFQEWKRPGEVNTAPRTIGKMREFKRTY